MVFFTAGCGTCGPGAQALGDAQRAAPATAHYVAADVEPSETPTVIRAFLADNDATGVAFAIGPDGRLISAYRLTQLSTIAVVTPDGDVVYRAVEPTTVQIRASVAKASTQ